MKQIRCVIAACFVFMAASAISSPPAGAHTGFESSDPADGSATNGPVETITLVFTGDAEPTGAGFEILDPDGTVRRPAEASTADGLTWVLTLDPPVSGGLVGVRWMVKAPDAHPIDGAFSFTAPDAVVVDEPLVAEATPRLTEPISSPAAEADQAVTLSEFLDTGDDAGAAPGRLGAAGRFVSLLGTLVGVGGLVFAATAMRGRRRDVRHVLFWVRRAGLVVMAGAVMEFLAQVATEAGGSWSALWSPSAIGNVVASTFGIAAGLRIVGGFALATGARLDTIAASEIADPVAAVHNLVSTGVGAAEAEMSGTVSASASGPPPNQGSLMEAGDHAWHANAGSVGAAVGALAVVAAHLFDGHTVSKGDRLFTGVVDIIHVAGSAVWAGGILMLAAVLWLRHREGRDLRARQLAMRFSVVATAALVLVGLAGVILTIIVLDSPSELWSTDWGRILLAKVAFVGLAAAAGAYNHNVLIPALDDSPDDPKLSRQFRNVVTGEATALVAVAIATAFLMGAAS